MSDTLSTPFRYPGSKARFADEIVKMIPRHELYVEPFCGAAAVFFAKPKSHHEILNDIDGDLVNFLTVLRDRPDELVDWLEVTPYSRELFREWDASLPEDAVSRAGAWWMMRYMRLFGMKDGHFPPPWLSVYDWQNGSNKISILRQYANRLTDAVIECQDWKKCVKSCDSENAFFFLDPPYLNREGRYGLDSFGHENLVEWLQQCEGKWLLTYGDEVPPGLEQFVVRDLGNQTNRIGAIKNVQPTENVLLANYDVNSVVTHAEEADAMEW